MASSSLSRDTAAAVDATAAADTVRKEDAAVADVKTADAADTRTVAAAADIARNKKNR